MLATTLLCWRAMVCSVRVQRDRMTKAAAELAAFTRQGLPPEPVVVPVRVRRARHRDPRASAAEAFGRGRRL